MSTPTPPRAGTRLNYDQSSRALQQQAPNAPGNALALVKEHRSYLDARRNQHARKRG